VSAMETPFQTPTLRSPQVEGGGGFLVVSGRAE